MDTRQLLAYFHPTKVALIDDNSNYLNSLHLELDFYHASYQLFDEPLKALAYLSTTISPQPSLSHEKSKPSQQIIEVDLSKIYTHIYNDNRFNEISVIVVDYAMPGIDGLSLCEKLKDKPFKKILLTGEAQEQKAIEGFNRGLIHKYVRKDDANFTTTINTAIYDLLYTYFTEKFQTLVSLPFLRDDKLKEQFSDKIETNKIVEYYLLDNRGSFLMLDSNGNSHYLGTEPLTIDKNKTLSYARYLETL